MSGISRMTPARRRRHGSFNTLRIDATTMATVRWHYRRLRCSGVATEDARWAIYDIAFLCSMSGVVQFVPGVP